MASSDLKGAVLRYIEVVTEERARAKHLAEVRALKKRLREQTIELLRDAGNDTAAIEGTGGVQLTAKRRLAGLKRSAVEAWASQLLAGSDRGAEEVARLYDSRAVTTVEDLDVWQA